MITVRDLRELDETPFDQLVRRRIEEVLRAPDGVSGVVFERRRLEMPL